MWTQDGFAAYMDELGFEVLSNTTCKDYNDKYMAPLGRKMKSDKIASAERFVVARFR